MRSIFVLVAGAVALAACAVETTNEPTATQTAEALSTFATPFVGSYQRADSAAILNTLVLNADGTYRSTQIVECFRAPCNPIETRGSWTASGTAFSGTLRLQPANGSAVKYAATLIAPIGSLQLQQAGSASFVETRLPSNCGGIAGIQCPSDFTCVPPSGTTYPDQMGTCLPDGALGTTCVSNPPCMEGLGCVIHATKGSITHVCQQ
ncbi:MAG TPA: hypothetical protein VGI39_25660 [Polyangiaceae bacterium]|jgi:hypothetical protein